MWEWTNHILKPRRRIVSRSLLSTYNDLLSQSASFPKINESFTVSEDNNGTTPSDTDMQNILLSRIRNSGLNLQLRIHAFCPQTWPEMDNIFAKYVRRRAVFLKFLGYTRSRECRKAGISREDIRILRQGLAPENFNTHIKIPFDFGGGLDFENFSLIPIRPVHNLIHRLIEIQIENGFLRTRKKIFIPWFEGKIYHD